MHYTRTPPPTPPAPPRLYLGLDLGQTNDYSALAIAERDRPPGASEPARYGVLLWGGRGASASAARCPPRRTRVLSAPVVEGAGLVVNLRVLVANEPLAYREVLAATFQALRPETDVALVEPGDLDEVVARGAAHLVVSSRTGTTSSDSPLTWVTLYPNHGREAIVRIGGHETRLPELELDGLLALLDETARQVPAG